MLQISDLLVKREGFEALLTSLNIADGQCVALCGVSGSGKSTLLEAISLVSPYQRTTIFNLDGYDIDALDSDVLEDVRIVKLGLMPQVGGLIPFLTIRENLGLQISLAREAALRLDKELLVKDQLIDYTAPNVVKFSQEKLYEYVQRFQLQDHLDKLPHELSIGQRQRALFLRAISHNPRLILIDEPTASLDPNNAQILFELIDEIAKTSKISILMVTHDERAMSYYKSYIYNARKSHAQFCVFEDEIYVHGALGHHQSRQELVKDKETTHTALESKNPDAKAHAEDHEKHDANAHAVDHEKHDAKAHAEDHEKHDANAHAVDNEHQDSSSYDKNAKAALLSEEDNKSEDLYDSIALGEDAGDAARSGLESSIEKSEGESFYSTNSAGVWPRLNLLQLSLKDLLFDRIMSFCAIAALASIIAPLLLLFSLRFGVLHELEQKLLSDPNVLSISLVSSYRLDDAFFKDLEANPNVGFVVPQVNAINAIVDLKMPKGVERVNALPTALGDPVVVKSGIPYSSKADALGHNEIFISAELSRKYQIQVGDKLSIFISRVQNGERQAANVQMTVKGVISPGYILKDAVLLNLETLDAIDDFRTGFNPQIISDGSNVKDTKRYYAKFRLYAKNIDSVIPLFYELEAKKLSLNSKIGEIENIKAIDRVLKFVFLIVALVSSIGGAVALGGLIFSSLKMRRKNFVVLRMIGQKPADTYFMVLIEALFVAVIGFAFALALFFIGSFIFNRYFSSVLGGASISLLTVEHALIFFAVTLAVSALISLLCAKYVFLKAKIADVLREA